MFKDNQDNPMTFSAEILKYAWNVSIISQNLDHWSHINFMPAE